MEALSFVQHQPRAVAMLRQALAAQALHHAWLFFGPPGVGKELTALQLAQALCCPVQPRVGCLQCPSCKRIGGRNHPDVTWVLTEEAQVARGWAARSDFDHVPSRDIRIDQVRRLQERLALRPLEAPVKVALVVDAEAMNPAAQNALLKTLEEPPGDTFLFLTSAAPDKLLPTIRSRCARASFGPLPRAFVAEVVARETTLGVLEADRVAGLAGGSLERALALDARQLSHRLEVITRFEALEPQDARSWLALAEYLSEDRATAEEALDTLRVWFRDVACVQAGAQEAQLVHAELGALARQAAARVSPASLQRRAVALEEARNAISARNGSVRLQLERFFIELHGG